MVPMSFDELEKAVIDSTDSSVPESVKIARPLLFRDGDALCRDDPRDDAAVFVESAHYQEKPTPDADSNL